MTKFTDDDEFNSIPASTTASAVGTPTATATAPSIDDDGEVDLILDHDSLKAKSSLANVLPKEANKVSRYALVKGVKAYAKATHFLAGAGASSKGMTVVCPGEGCAECAKGGDHGSRRKVVALAVHYVTDANGKFAPGTTKPEVSIGFIGLSPTAYTELTACPSEDETIYTVDFKSSKKSNGIGWTFGRMSSPPAYVKAGMEAEVAALAAEVDPKVLKGRLGKTVSLTELKAIVSGVSLSSLDSGATLADLESLD